MHPFLTGISWFMAKVGIARQVVRAYLTRPLYALGATA